MNRKGFTLIELIATIVLLGIVASISFVSINKVIEKNKVNNCISLVSNIKAAAGEYASDRRYDKSFVNKISLTNPYSTTITANDLVSEKYLSSPITNPADKNNTITPNSIEINIYFNYDYTVKYVAVDNADLESINGCNLESDSQNTYTVVLNGNGATNSPTMNTKVTLGSKKMTQLLMLPERQYTVTFNHNSLGVSVSPDRKLTSTYTFNGWYTSETGGSKVASNSIIPVLEANVSGYTSGNGRWIKEDGATLYANWTNKAITLPTVTKSGYTCAWYTSKTGGQKIGNDGGGGTYTPTDDIQLFAQCTSHGYTITLNGNGATNNPTASVTVNSGDTKLSSIGTLPVRQYTVSFNANGQGATISSTSAMTAKYDFDGWFSAANGGRRVASADSTPILQVSINGYTNTKQEWIRTSDTTLYAKWISKTLTLPTIEKTGYTCGWYTSKTGGNQVGTNKGYYTPTADTTLYVQCTPNTYKITLNKNGATNSPTSETKVVFDDTKLSAIATLPVKQYKVSFNANSQGATISSTSAITAEYTFDGWYTLASNGSKVASNAKTPVLEANVSGYTNSSKKWIRPNDTELFARWTGGSITLPTITKTGYTCSWYTSKTGGTKYNSGGSYTPTANITLFVRCTANTYTITLDKNGATNSSTSSTTVTYNNTSLKSLTTLPVRKYTVSFNTNSQGASISSTSTLTATYTFNGWYTASNGGSKVANNAKTPALQASVSGYTDSSKRWIKTSNTTLYAGWTNGSITLPTITKTGYTCGWYTSKSGGTKYDSGSNYTPTADTTLYARCMANTYTIELDSNGATTVGTTEIYQKYATGYYLDSSTNTQMTTSSNNITIPEKDGYKFDGYYTSNDGTGTQYINESGYITDNVNNANCSSNNCKLYANWIETKKTVTITYKTILVGNCGRPNYCEGGTKLVTVGEKYGDLCESDKFDDGSLWITPKRWYIDDGFDYWDWASIYLNDTTNSGKRVSPIDSNSIVQIAEDHYVYILSFCYVGGATPGSCSCTVTSGDGPDSPNAECQVQKCS